MKKGDAKWEDVRSGAGDRKRSATIDSYASGMYLSSFFQCVLDLKNIVSSWCSICVRIFNMYSPNYPPNCNIHNCIIMRVTLPHMPQKSMCVSINLIHQFRAHCSSHNSPHQHQTHGAGRQVPRRSVPGLQSPAP